MNTPLCKALLSSFRVKFCTVSKAFAARRGKLLTWLTEKLFLYSLDQYACSYLNERSFYKEYRFDIVILIQSNWTLAVIGTERVNRF